MRIRFIFCAFVQLTFLPSVLFAHAYLVKSVPAGRATLFSSPTKVQLFEDERYKNITVMLEGFQGWEKRKYPVEIARRASGSR